MPVSKQFDGEKFWTVENGKKIATPLLMVIAWWPDRRDLRGRLDPRHLRHHQGPVHRADQQRVRHPGPARDVLPAAGGGQPFHLLNYGLAVILVFIGTKMMLIDIFKIPVAVSLGVVLGILAITMVWSAKSAQHLSLPHPRPGGLCWPVGAPTGACRPFFR
jgi:tellurite resistance protein TerC